MQFILGLTSVFLGASSFVRRPDCAPFLAAARPVCSVRNNHALCSAISPALASNLLSNCPSLQRLLMRHRFTSLYVHMCYTTGACSLLLHLLWSYQQRCWGRGTLWQSFWSTFHTLQFYGHWAALMDVSNLRGSDLARSISPQARPLIPSSAMLILLRTNNSTKGWYKSFHASSNKTNSSKVQRLEREIWRSLFS